MIEKFLKIFLILTLSFIYSCQSPTTVVYDEGSVKKGMSRKEMSKIFRFKVLGGHNPFKGECFHEYYPLKQKEIISGNAQVLTSIDSEIEPIFYILENVTISSHKTFLQGNACLHGNGTLATWVKGHYEALDHVSKN